MYAPRARVTGEEKDDAHTRTHARTGWGGLGWGWGNKSPCTRERKMGESERNGNSRNRAVWNVCRQVTSTKLLKRERDYTQQPTLIPCIRTYVKKEYLLSAPRPVPCLLFASLNTRTGPRSFPADCPASDGRARCPSPKKEGGDGWGRVEKESPCSLDVG